MNKMRIVLSVIILALAFSLAAAQDEWPPVPEPKFEPNNFMLVQDIKKFDLDYVLTWTDSASRISPTPRSAPLSYQDTL